MRWPVRLAALAASASAAEPLKRERGESNGMEVWFNIPSAPAAVAVFYHGCSHMGENFFWMPEEAVVARRFLDKNWAVLSFTSPDNDVNNGCWDKDESTVEMGVTALDKFLENNSLTDIPVYGLGASSGGDYVSLVAAKFPFTAIAIYISPAAYLGASARIPKKYPPTVMVYMTKDEKWASKMNIENFRINLDERGVESEDFPVKARPFDEKLLERLVEPKLEPAVIKAIIAAFRETELSPTEKFLSPKGHLNIDPREFPGWKGKLRGVCEDATPPVKLTEKLKRGVEEQLNVAWASHEFTSEHSEAVTNWLDSTMARQEIRMQVMTNMAEGKGKGIEKTTKAPLNLPGAVGAHDEGGETRGTQAKREQREELEARKGKKGKGKHPGHDEL